MLIRGIDSSKTENQHYKVRFLEIIHLGDSLFHYNQLLNEKNNTYISWEDRGLEETFWIFMSEWYNNLKMFFTGCISDTFEVDTKWDKFYEQIMKIIEDDETEYTGEEIWKKVEKLIF